MIHVYYLCASVHQFHLSPLCLYGIQNQDTLQKELDLLTAISDGVGESCLCGFSRSYFASGGFRCFQDSAEGAVTYRTQLNAPNGTVDFLEQISLWLSTSPSVSVTGVLLQLDSSCNLVIESFSDRECGVVTEQETTIETPLESSQLNLIIGGGIGFAVMILVLFVCLLVIVLLPVLLWRKFKTKSKQYETQ